MYALQFLEREGVLGICLLESVVYRKFNPLLYFIADPSLCHGRAVEDVVFDAVRGGATMVQLRNKIDKIDTISKQYRKIRYKITDESIPILINDHVALAAEVGADGVHIGQGDMKPEQARAMIGDDKILGLTAFTRAHYDAVDPMVIDYVGTGPVFPTKTDKGKPVLGVDGFRDLIRYAPVPVVGIGGITANNAWDVIGAGVNGIAMMRAISEADDPCIAARELLNSIK